MSRKSRMKAQKRKQSLKKKSKRYTASPFRLLNAELPIYGSYILDVDVEEQGMTSVVIARNTVGGNLVFGGFLIDVWGVGLKDCFGDIGVPPRQFEREVLNRHPEMKYKPCDLTHAQRLIWGGVEHAKKHGFKLPREFRDWSKIVGKLPPDAPPIEFGKDGELFVIGEVDDIASRMGTTPENAMKQIGEQGHFIVGIDPEETVVVDDEMLVDEEMDNSDEDIDDSDVDLIIDAPSTSRESKETPLLAPRRPRRKIIPIR